VAGICVGKTPSFQWNTCITSATVLNLIKSLIKVYETQSDIEIESHIVSISAGPNNYVFYDEEDYFQPEKVRLQSLKAILKLLDLNGCSPYLGIYLVLTVED
jgi:hypothetical protein